MFCFLVEKYIFPCNVPNRHVVKQLKTLDVADMHVYAYLTCIFPS